MERKWGLEFITLTLNDEYKDLTDETAKRYAKKLLDALKIEAKRRGNWSYKIWVYFSREEIKPDETARMFLVHSQQSKRPHFHVILYAIPCITITKWMQNYWNSPKASKRKRLGIVHRERIWDLCGAVSYCNRQKCFKERIQCYEGADPVDLERITDYEIERQIKAQKG